MILPKPLLQEAEVAQVEQEVPKLLVFGCVGTQHSFSKLKGFFLSLKHSLVLLKLSESSQALLGIASMVGYAATEALPSASQHKS